MLLDGVYYFSATWCGPCKTFKPLFKRVAEELGLDTREIDVDEEADFASSLQIMSVPTIVVFDNGLEADRLVGAFPEKILRERLTNLG